MGSSGRLEKYHKQILTKIGGAMREEKKEETLYVIPFTIPYNIAKRRCICM